MAWLKDAMGAALFAAAFITLTQAPEIEMSTATPPIPATIDHRSRERSEAAQLAESVLHLFECAYPDDSTPRRALRYAHDYATGRCNADEICQAWLMATSYWQWAAAVAERAEDTDHLRPAEQAAKAVMHALAPELQLTQVEAAVAQARQLAEEAGRVTRHSAP